MLALATNTTDAVFLASTTAMTKAVGPEHARPGQRRCRSQAAALLIHAKRFQKAFILLPRHAPNSPNSGIALLIPEA
jgi:hypothetical protein